MVDRYRERLTKETALRELGSRKWQPDDTPSSFFEAYAELFDQVCIIDEATMVAHLMLGLDSKDGLYDRLATSNPNDVSELKVIVARFYYSDKFGKSVVRCHWQIIMEN